jgi:hypothetical protein
MKQTKKQIRAQVNDAVITTLAYIKEITDADLECMKIFIEDEMKARKG